MTRKITMLLSIAAASLSVVYGAQCPKPDPERVMMAKMKL